MREHLVSKNDANRGKLRTKTTNISLGRITATREDRLNFAVILLAEILDKRKTNASVGACMTRENDDKALGRLKC